MSTRVLNNFADYQKSERQNAVNEYVAQYDNLSDSQKSNYKNAQQYGEARVSLDDSINVMVGMVGGGVGKVAKSFDAVVQQSKMLEGVANSRAMNVIKAVFKDSDTIPGGTMGALRNEIMTGLETKGIFHSNKARNVINSIKNIFKTETLNLVEINRLQGIKNSLESLIKNIE